MRPVTAASNTPERPWALDGAAVLEALGTDGTAGLGAAEATARLHRFGPNRLTARVRRAPRWWVAIETLANVPTGLLVIAAAGAAILGDHLAAVVLLVMVGIDWVIGLMRASRGGRAWAGIVRMASPTARVVRDGSERVIPASSLVRGDLVPLETGDVVPADLRLLDAVVLHIDERALTGGPEPVAKSCEAIPRMTGERLADQRDMAFLGTLVTFGRGTGVVTATGMATALARTAELHIGTRPGPTPLERRLTDLDRTLTVAIVILVAMVMLVGLANETPLDRLVQAVVGIAIAAIPAALPAMAVVSLMLGARRLSRRGARVRDSSVIGTIGSVSVICADTTGTLTAGRMLAERVWTPFGEYHLGGTGYEPTGAIVGDDDPSDDPFLPRLAQVAAACADATLAAPRHHGDPWTVTGDPTDGALLALATRLGISTRDLRERHPRLARFTIDPTRRWTTTLLRDHERIWVAVRGTLDALVVHGDADEQDAWERARETAERWTADGYHVIALAERSLDALPVSVEAAESALSILGLVGVADPPRPGAAAAVAAANRAGIRTVAIGGDDPPAARGIGRRLGILGDGAGTLTGAELDALDDDDLDRIVVGVAVHARAGPAQKQRIIESWKRKGAVVAVTGDGADDAASLGLADVGIAKGVRGAAVSKLTADMVLEGDDHATIIAAVEEGRRSHGDIRRLVRYTLTSSVAATMVVLLAPLAGLSVPLSLVQLLWVKLAIDGLTGLALIAEPAGPDTMRRPPRPSSESVLAGGSWQHVLWVGLLMGVVTLGVGILAMERGWPWQTMVFCLLAFLQLGHALAIRWERRGCLQIGWRRSVLFAAAAALVIVLQLATIYAPQLQPVFGTRGLTWVELAVVLAASALAFVGVEGAKSLWQQRPSKPMSEEGAPA